ncbi:stage II sporulation protein M [Enterococcus sp. BWB1-3]|uniref:stage II sporulation protein M n=1 Tax=Enterococcus sp. BWB1-3 TaxID=2787713 RepID=UPI0019220D1E|nr:stage II sporulation protein M [Enterococcus sp. BWB1-3]MBL1229295.1 stage II sporulation protein M [Enterococcus sp. BWB1-3]
MKFSYVFSLSLAIGIGSLILGLLLSNPVDTNPDLNLDFSQIFLTNSKIHIDLLINSIISLGIGSILFICYQFFIVGILVGGASQTVGIYSALSFFWIHGVIELLAAIIVASIIPYVYINLFLLIVKHPSKLTNLSTFFKFISILIFVNFSLVFLAALLECYVAPLFVHI